MTDEEMLTAVESAIEKILSGGQSYSLNSQQGSQSVTRASLSELYRMRDDLRARINSSSGSNFASLIV